MDHVGGAYMDRRRFISAVTLSLLTAPLAAQAQQAGKVRRIGYIDQGSAARNRPYFEAFRQGLRDLGWVEGQNVAIEVRFAEGKTDQLPTLAAELVRLKVDLIVTSSTPAALAAKHATTTIPIVIGFAADPVGSGLVASLARPGGNITGWTHQGLELRAKYLGLLKEAVPKATRFGVLWNPTNQIHGPTLKLIEAAAQKLKVELHLVGVQDPKEIESTFSALVGKRVEALVVFPDGMFIAQTPLIIALAARSRLPAMYGVREYAEAGGLMAYGANLSDMHRRGATYVDKILKGAKPADLPVEQPTKFELVINLKTAKALGLTIPPSLLLRADELIQ
jgi:putative tryptophan/tyrosine transport system substrate-binding protein